MYSLDVSRETSNRVRFINTLNISMKNEELIDEYLRRMLKSNENINLTRVTDYEQAKLLHIEDSLAVFEEFEKAPKGMYGDLGSGCGFPGVALSIASGRSVILIDSVKKKMSVVGDIIHSLRFDNQIKTKGLRIEDLSKEMREEFSVLTARALCSLPSLLELASPLLCNGGQLIALKSHVEDDEYKRAISIEGKTGMRLLSKRSYDLSDGMTFRSVYVFEKFKEPDIQLPRRVGMAQKRPLA